MKPYMMLFILAVFAFGCAEADFDGEQYGEALTLSETTAVSSILADPESSLGETLLIEGRVLDVCKMRGCWMEIAGDEPFQTMRVKVDDGVIVFPMTARGKTARVEGQLYKIEMSLEEAREFLAHQAEEKGEAFDSTTVDGPMTLYQLKGAGAVISP